MLYNELINNEFYVYSSLKTLQDSLIKNWYL